MLPPAASPQSATAKPQRAAKATGWALIQRPTKPGKPLSTTMRMRLKMPPMSPPMTPQTGTASPIGEMAEADMRRAEIGVVAENGLGGEARHDDGGDDEAAGIHLEGFRQLLDAEDDACQRRVEGRGDARPRRRRR